MIEMIMIMAFVLFGVWAVKPYSESNIKERIRQDMTNPLIGTAKSNGARLPPDWLNRFKGLINGDYPEEHYKKWLKRFNDAVFDQKMKKDSADWSYLPSKRLKSACIEAFQVVMALEYGCTRGHFVNCLKAAVPTDIMNEMTYLLMRAAIDHINEHVSPMPADWHDNTWRASTPYHVWLSSDDIDFIRIYEAGCN